MSEKEVGAELSIDSISDSAFATDRACFKHAKDTSDAKKDLIPRTNIFKMYFLCFHSSGKFWLGLIFVSVAFCFAALLLDLRSVLQSAQHLYTPWRCFHVVTVPNF